MLDPRNNEAIFEKTPELDGFSPAGLLIVLASLPVVMVVVAGGAGPPLAELSNVGILLTGKVCSLTVSSLGGVPAEELLELLDDERGDERLNPLGSFGGVEGVLEPSAIAARLCRYAEATLSFTLDFGS